MVGEVARPGAGATENRWKTGRHDREPVRQTGGVDELIRAAAAEFLRGEASVVDFTYAFRAAANVVVRDRPLRGYEVRLFHALEEWENSGWAGRPAIVDALRVLVASAVATPDGAPPA